MSAKLTRCPMCGQRAVFCPCDRHDLFALPACVCCGAALTTVEEIENGVCDACDLDEPVPFVPTEVGRAYLSYKNAGELVNTIGGDLQEGAEERSRRAATTILGYTQKVLRGLGASHLIEPDDERSYDL
jgi:hypothetical protein